MPKSDVSAFIVYGFRGTDREFPNMEYVRIYALVSEALAKNLIQELENKCKSYRNEEEKLEDMAQLEKRYGPLEDQAGFLRCDRFYFEELPIISCLGEG